MAPGRRLNIGEAPVALPQIRIHVWPTWAFVFGKRGGEMAGSQKETRTAGDEAGGARGGGAAAQRGWDRSGQRNPLGMFSQRGWNGTRSGEVRSHDANWNEWRSG